MGAWPVLHTTFEDAIGTIPVATLLMNVTKQMDLGLGTVDGLQQLLGGAPATSARQIQDAEGSIVGHDDVDAFGDVVVDVAGARVATARVPASAPDLQAHDLHQLMVQDFGIGDFALEIVRVLSFRFCHPPTIQPGVGVPKIMVACDDEHVPILVLDRSKPVIEISQFAVIAHFCDITGVDQNVCIGQVPGRAMKRMGVADVQDGHNGWSVGPAYFETAA
mmetsp:Transcript_189/g.254  ORF Transcript_189/g.254 Transcript_189/m.254 type:complete len:220 (+) Transcript_189:231-890(+)